MVEIKHKAEDQRRGDDEAIEQQGARRSRSLGAADDAVRCGDQAAAIAGGVVQQW